MGAQPAHELVQSGAILRYVGRLGGLYPAGDALLCARIDALMDFEADLFTGLRVLRYKQRFGFPGGEDAVLTEAACARVAQELNASVFPRHLRSLDAALARGELAAGGNPCWVAGTATPTIADFCLAPALQWLREGCATQGVSMELLAPFPRIGAWLARFEALAGVRAWYAKRAALLETQRQEAEAEGTVADDS